LTEAGSCISFSDGKAGLPESILTRSANAAVQFRICDDELQVKTAHGMRQYLNPGEANPRDAQGWLSTGDLVRVEHDRIYFVGRRSETINVGGVKVQPLEVENVVSVVPGVQLARVYGRENPIMGQIVAVELVLVEGHDPVAVEDAVREACLVLPRHSRPRSVDIVDTIATSNFKLVRRGATPK
jgi:acyl-CoA synthetase (AMP-forming)/AMP-acid ligase II